MRIVSLVPSWTETLLATGLNVVGRTRFCIHPEQLVSSIPRVGGTKDWNWPAIQKLKPDLLLLDQEENPKFMAEQNEIPYMATHITSVESVAPELTRMAERLHSTKLAGLAQRWQAIAQAPALAPWTPHQ